MKFHLTVFVPSSPGASALSHFHKGCASAPLTSTFSIIGKLTP